MNSVDLLKIKRKMKNKSNPDFNSKSPGFVFESTDYKIKVRILNTVSLSHLGHTIHKNTQV